MKIIRKSISRKFGLFLAILALAIYGLMYLAESKKGLTEVPTDLGVMLIFGILFFVFFVFLWMVAHPIGRISKQIAALLTGKKYQRLRPMGVDETSIITHFFNKITKNLENMSTDIINQKQLNLDLAVAKEIQNDIFPKESPPMVGLDVVARTKSASEIGGDSFDFIETDDGVMMYIGDVTGHGVAASLIMIIANTLLHVFSKMGLSTKEILTRTNEVLNHRISSNRFMTMAMIKWESENQRMTLVGAGHEHTLVYRAKSKEVEVIRTGGIALRMIKDISMILDEKKIELEEGDAVLLYTDGITEARNEFGEMFGVERLEESLKKNGGRGNTESIFDAITEDFSRFLRDNSQEDDITMIIARKLPKEEKRRQRVKLLINIDKNKSTEKENTYWSW